MMARCAPDMPKSGAPDNGPPSGPTHSRLRTGSMPWAKMLRRCFRTGTGGRTAAPPAPQLTS
eukprot:2049663-Alexandrium_andersonii.AAC.1